jgi:hypothetical protein
MLNDPVMWLLALALVAIVAVLAWSRISASKNQRNTPPAGDDR